MKAFFFTALLMLNMGTQLTAQTVSRWTGELQHGFIITHASDLGPAANSKPFGFRGSYEVLQQGREAWLACNCHHILGVDFSYHNFNNPEVLGGAYSFSGTFEPIIWYNEKWQFSIRSGMGVSYISKVYDEEHNPENNFFSSPISFLLFVSPKLSYKLSEKWMANLFFNYNHISNGGQRQPNRGMNFPMLGLGASYWLDEYQLKKYEPEDLINKFAFYVETFGTFRDNPAGFGRKPSFGFSGGGLFPVGKVNGFGAGAELNWDLAAGKISENSRTLIAAPYVSHHFLFGRFDFSQRLSYYVHKPIGYQVDRSFFQRYILNYMLFDGISVGVGLKAHGHVAENIDVRIGWRK